MKVILLRDVARIGRRYDIREVPSGHALNFLIPQKLAQIATPENVKRVEERKSKHATNEADELLHFKTALAALEATPIEIAVAANEQGHLFQAVKVDDIVSHAQAMGLALKVSYIELGHPLKSLGDHEVTLMYGDAKGVCTVRIVKK